MKGTSNGNKSPKETKEIRRVIVWAFIKSEEKAKENSQGNSPTKEEILCMNLTLR